MGLLSRSVILLVGATTCGISGYLLYSFFLKKDDPDDPDDDIPIPDSHTIEMPIPKDSIRALIGRNGKQIKLIQDQSEARINFRDEKEDEKVCVIKGTPDQCRIARGLIQDFIQNRPVLESEDHWVPHTCVGKIIGRSGEKIMEIRSLSGAKITVSDFQDDHSMEIRGFNSRRIIIKGSKEQILVAKSLIEEVVDQALKSQRKVESFLSKREPRLPPPRSPERLIESPKGERISPVPGQPDAQFEVYVSAMVDPSKFWLQIVGPKASELDCLVEEMTDYYGKSENRQAHVLDEIQKGDLVAAVFQYDKKWYRAEVLNVLETNTPKKVELYYVDYGDTDTVPLDELFELRTDFLRLHFQAIECFLARVDPVGGRWSEAAVDRFEEWTHVAQWKKLSAKINGYSEKRKVSRMKREGSPVPGIDLFDISDQRDLDIAEELVKAGLAVFKKEVLDSSRNGTCSSRTTSISNLSVASSS